MTVQGPLHEIDRNAFHRLRIRIASLVGVTETRMMLCSADSKADSQGTSYSKAIYCKL